MKNRKTRGQFGLMASKRFAPFFWTQFFGAFNDNVFKNALLLTLVYGATGQSASLWGNLAAGAFILPFFIFSATAGQLADKCEKAGLVRRLKKIEIGIMGAAAVAFYFDSRQALLVLLFLMGAQSSFFGPVKYSLLPQHLETAELVGGNALVEAGTFLAILMGTIAGGVLIQSGAGTVALGAVLVCVAVAGYGVSRGIPGVPAAEPRLKIGWNPIRQTIRTLGYARRDKGVFLAMCAVSWFWFLGAAYLTQLPAFVRTVINGSEGVVTLLLTVFSVGVGGGSLLCETLSNRRVEVGIVPLGSLGLSVFGLDLAASAEAFSGASALGALEFMHTAGSTRLMIDLLGIGLFGGVYIVPLFAYLQYRTAPRLRARVIAANNIWNALAMVLASVAGAFLLGGSLVSIPQFFGLIALTNFMLGIFICCLAPALLLRFCAWGITHVLYRLRYKKLNHIPDQGAAVLVSNHVSYVDALLIAGACRRPIRFVMYEPIYRAPLLHWLFRWVKAIPINSGRQNPAVLRQALNQISKALENGELVCIFPEGRLTRNGEIGRFRPGIERILKRNPVPVVPLALRGLWGSFFSRKRGAAMGGMPQRFWSRIEIAAAPPVQPALAHADHLQGIVTELRGEWR